MVSFERACALVETGLQGTTRQDILSDVSTSNQLGKNLERLRDCMRSHVWPAGGQAIDLAQTIKTYDTRTRKEGLHALNDWDGIADTVNADTIAVDVLNYLIEIRGKEPADPVVPAILLDYYFMYVLALLSLRIWDEGNPDANLDRLDQLLRLLQGPNGSGQQFAADAETLILIATSHFELAEHGYDLLLTRVRTLDHAHQTRVALGHAPCLGSHLRFGFEATYGRDTVDMRNDNVADYPWLCFSVSTLMREYVTMREAAVAGPARDAVVEAMLNGLTPDARAFVGGPPASLASCEVERSGFRARFQQHAPELIEHFERYRPSDHAYSPISFFFNFSHNVLKGTVVDALLTSRPWELRLNDLLTSSGRDDASDDSKETLARTLMAYARANPHKIRGKLMPVIVYDPQAGRQAFSVTMRKLRE